MLQDVKKGIELERGPQRATLVLVRCGKRDRGEMAFFGGAPAAGGFGDMGGGFGGGFGATPAGGAGFGATAAGGLFGAPAASGFGHATPAAPAFGAPDKAAPAPELPFGAYLTTVMTGARKGKENKRRRARGARRGCSRAASFSRAAKSLGIDPGGGCKDGDARGLVFESDVGFSAANQSMYRSHVARLRRFD